MECAIRGVLFLVASLFLNLKAKMKITVVTDGRKSLGVLADAVMG